MKIQTFFIDMYVLIVTN